MKTYGTATLVNGYWSIQCQPHVALRLKRMFESVHKNNFDAITLRATDEVCRDLLWFTQRFPLEFSVDDFEELHEGAERYIASTEAFDALLSGKAQPRDFELALPARDYQRVAASLILEARGLLLADDVGVGKTLSAICAMTDARTRPALVVTLTHLPIQWEREIKRFCPELRTHILKKGTPYDVRAKPRQKRVPKDAPFPDVLITNYHKLSGWAESLAGIVNSVFFDECQELRRFEEGGVVSQKSAAARHIAAQCSYRVGLSVGPDSRVELRGGAFGNGWVGRIEDAYEIANAASTNGIVFGRGWVGAGFGWKPIKRFMRHKCTSPVRRVRLGGVSFVATDDHSVFRATETGIVELRTDELTSGDVLVQDDGCDWAIDEVPLSIPDLARGLDRAQVNVNLSKFTRHDFGLTAWQWQNCHKEASYGPRLPLETYLRHRERFTATGPVYIGRGRAAALPTPLLLSDAAYMLGFFLGDGWISNGQRICFAIENPRVRAFCTYLESLPFGLRPKVRAMRGKSVEVRCTHKLLAHVLTAILGNRRCYDKRIPAEWMLSWPTHARRSLVRGMVDADGHIRRDSRGRSQAYYTTTSPHLALDLLTVLRSLGLRPGLHQRQPTLGGVVAGRRITGRRPIYQVYWSWNDFNGRSDGKRGQRRRLKWSRGKFVERIVSNTEAVDPPRYVYDLEMSGHPSFVANGILVHNSATPIYNYGGEFWNVLSVLRPDALGTREEFCREWCSSFYDVGKARIKDPAAFGVYLRESGLMLRRTRQDVGRELPGVSHIVQHCDVSHKELEEAEDAASELAKIILAEDSAWEERGQATRELDWRLRQATGIAKAPHVAAFVRMLVESGEKVVLYGWHRAVYDLWLDRLDDLRPVMFTGSESPVQKDRARKEFCDGNSQVLIMSLRAGAGLDGLQFASRTVVNGELDWSPGVHEQGAGRVFRDGQPDPVTVYYLVSDFGSDPIVSETLGLKRAQIEMVRDPNADLVTKLDSNAKAGIRKLAEMYLQRRSKHGDQHA